MSITDELRKWGYGFCMISVKRPYYEAPSYCPECGARVVES